MWLKFDPHDVQQETVKTKGKANKKQSSAEN